jgi:hypothetical protein
MAVRLESRFFGRHSAILQRSRFQIEMELHLVRQFAIEPFAIKATQYAA